MRTPTEHLATLRGLEHGLAIKIERKLAVGGRVSAFESERNAEEIAAVAWAISTLDRLLKKAREAREARRETAVTPSPPEVMARDQT